MADCKKFFVEHSLTTIEDFFDYVQHHFHYGWKDQRGAYHHDTNSAKGYALQPPDELLQSQIGNCWDMAELYRCWFQTMTNLSIATYFIFYDDHAGCPSHAILTYRHPNEDQIYWFEPLFGDVDCNYDGVHVYQSLEELLRDFCHQFIQISLIKGRIPENYDPAQIKLHHYLQPHYHITGAEMREHIERGKSLPIITP